MTCQNSRIELCKACRCCFYHKLVLRRIKWCFYSHVFNTKLRPLPLVAARSPCFFFFFFFAAIRSLSHCPCCPRQPAFLQARWYAFLLVCVPTALRIERRWRFSSSSSPKCLSVCLNKGFHLWYLMRMEHTPRFLLANQVRWDVWQVANSTCTNKIFQKI